MKQLLELRKKKAELHTQMKTIVNSAETEHRALTADENEKFKALQKEITQTCHQTY